MNKIKIWFIQLFCTHRDFNSGWLVQGVRYRKCKKCNLIDVQTANGKPDYLRIRPDLKSSFKNG